MQQDILILKQILLSIGDRPMFSKV